MKIMVSAGRKIGIFGMALWLSSCSFFSSGDGCWTGAFIADQPDAKAITDFQRDYGKKPYMVLTFLDWGKFPEADVVRDVYSQGSVLVLTWEPWDAASKQGVDYGEILSGKEDAYLREFALRLKNIGQPVFLRFAHEMNGDWYPWAGMKIGPRTYQRLFRYVHGVFQEVGAANVRWIFSVNAENVPVSNDYDACYPGDRYVDYLGLDGYNWGTAKPWSRWQSFSDIFAGVYRDVARRYGKPVLITEFSSASQGGDKAGWIREAFREIRNMPAVKSWILFNIDKEADWSFAPGTATGRALASGIASDYFRDGTRRETV